MFSKSALAVTLPLLVSSAIAGDCVRRYTVKDGDTCDSISADNSVSTYQLAMINKGYIDEQCGNLDPGASICLGYEGEDCTSTYVVKAQDTCDQINSAHSLDITTLLANNPQINDKCDNIYVGEVLCVLPEIRVPPSGSGSGSGATASVNLAPPASATLASQATPTSSGSDNSNNGDNSGDDDDESLPYCDEL
ncbi:hypothetical protein V5O48_004450 [Marasmius crinis-equi]|uniref:LysM domain-containing protein n=1 Tax=Marasmius crinis-equi TaxID=585013 RepID=A0ABR3FQK5_9AGAR